MVLCLQPERDHKNWSRENGWSFPLHPFQLLAWLFLVMFALLYFGVLVPSLPSGTWQITAYVTNGMIFLLHIIIHLISISLNPADPNVRAKNYKGPLPYFDRNKHAHVIENQFCYICEVKVGIKSKHCSACNKCVSSFDHHCKWLNNCIGKRNYRLFIICVASALLGCLVILATSIALVVAYFINDSWLYLPQELRVVETSTLSGSFSTVSSFSTASYPISSTIPFVTPSSNITYTGTFFYVFIPVTGILWLVVVIFTAALSLLGVVLLGHLLFFHICLIVQGLSTYEYIVQKRQDSSNDNNASVTTNSSYHQPKTSCWNHCLKQMLHKKVNQVSPVKRGSNNVIRGEEIELSSPSGQKIALPNVVAIKEKEHPMEETLEKFTGNVYLGSPHRRRHFLEPLYLRPSKNIDIQAISRSQEKDGIEECVGMHSTTGKTPESEHPPGNDNRFVATTSNHVLGRKRHNSTSPTLPPIMEVDGSWCKKELLPLQRSISSQSLHSLKSEDEENQTLEKGLGEKTNSSLSNLLLGVATDDDVFDDTDDGDAVQEICIVQDSEHAPGENRKVVGNETKDRSQSMLSFPILNTTEQTATPDQVPRLARCLSLNEMIYLNPKSPSNRVSSAGRLSSRNKVHLAVVPPTGASCNIAESSCANQNDIRVYHKGKSFAAVQEITTIPVFDSVVMEYHSTYRQSPIV